MRKLVKICLLSTVVFLGLVFILLGGSLLYLQTDHAQSLIQRKIHGLIPGSVSWEKSHLSPLKGEFTLQNLSLKGPLDEDIAGLERVSLNLSWMSLLKGNLTIESIIGEKPWAAFHLDEKGELNLKQAFAHSKPGGPIGGEGTKERKGMGLPFGIVVKSLKLVNGVISYEMVSKGLKIEAKEIYFISEGDLLQRRGDVDIQIGSGRIDGPGVHVTLAGCKMRAALSRSGIKLQLLEVTTSSSNVTASGEIRDIVRKPLFDLVLDTTVSLSEVRESLHVTSSFTGEAAIQSAIKGSLDNPEVDLRLDYSGGLISEIPIDRANLNLYLKDRLMSVKKAEADIASGTIAVQGDINLHHAFEHGFLAAQRNLEEISYDVFLKGHDISLECLPHPVSNTLRGTMSFGLALSGKGLSFRTLFANAVLETDVKGLSISTLMAPIDLFVRTNIDIKGRVATIKGLEAKAGDIVLRANGQLDIPSKEITANLSLKAASLEKALLFLGLEKFYGECKVKGKASGPIKNPTFALFIQGDHLRYKEISIGSVRLAANLDQWGRLDIPGITIENQGSLIKGKAKVHGTLSLQAKGTIPLQVARLFVDELPDITGNASLSAAVTGTWAHPDIRGEMELKDVGFSFPSIGQKVYDLSGTIRITPQMVTIDTLEGRMATGRFSAAGTMELEGIRPDGVNLAIDVQGIPLQVPDMLDVLLNAMLQIQGTPDRSSVQGEVVILEGTYYKDVNLSLLQVVGERKREEAPRPKEITLPFMKNMSVDISIRRRNPFVVDNNLAHLDINPDLRISGTLSNPMITGRATIEAGTVTYRKKTFTVKKGEIDFSNPYKIEPVFDIEGEVQVRKWTILLAISGPPDNLSLTLTSEPPEEDGDILSLLLFGRTTHELIEAEGGTTKSTTRMLAGILATTLEDDIRKATGLDILEVETQAQEEDQVSDQVKVTLGKELSKRMTLKYAVESKDGELSQRAIAEYKLLEGILLNGFQDDKGATGGELFFRLEFR